MFATLAAVVGLIAGVTVTLGVSLIHAWPELLLAVLVTAVVLRWKVPYWAVILAAGGAGALWFRP